ncbi:MAG TPA: nuclear transport factor 2 family protein [Acidimicrobiales bacterium]|nr:nuclear transport factor 2 family protein [Acidimicrobiales bacterium]
MTPDDLVAIEAIKQVKYRYLRAVDTRDWDLLATTLTEDATSAYSSGKLSYEGRDAIIAFLRESMPEKDMLTSHKVHHPEIELTGPDTADARWALEDVVIILPAGLTLRGAAYYEDKMARVDGQWRIAHTGYRRLYEEMTPRKDETVTDHWWKD